MSTWTFDAIGTRFAVDVVPSGDGAAVERPSPRTRESVRELVDGFDREWSRFRPDSLVTALAAGGSVAAPRDAVLMLDALASAWETTSGAVSPLIGASLASLGYDARYSLRSSGARPAPDWRDTLTWSAETLTLSRPGVIDVGALGKGRLVDRVLEMVVADAPDAETIVVDGSGDLRVHGGPVRVALEHPHDPTRAIGVWTLIDQAIAASAVNRRAWPDPDDPRGFHHVLDGRTGLPVRDVIATWAVAGTAMAADLVATALFFDGGSDVAAEHDAAWVRVLSTGAVETSDVCPAQLFTVTR